MFSLRQDVLLLSLRPFEPLPMLPGAEERSLWDRVEPGLRDRLAAGAEAALVQPPPIAPASAFKRHLEKGDPLWLETRNEALRRLRALVLGACVTGSVRCLEAVADALYALCEQSDWAMTQALPDFPDATHGTIDLAACETGAELSAALALLGRSLDGLSHRISALVYHTLDVRLITPMIQQQPGVWQFEREEAPRAAAALLTTVLCCEHDDRRRWLSLRWILRLLDSYVQSCPGDGGFARGLDRHLETVCALNDCFALLSAASGGEVELRDQPFFQDIAGSFLKYWAGRGWFFNPGGESMRPSLSPDLLFRLGEGARINALCGLAAWLQRTAPQEGLPDAPLLQQVACALGRSALLGHVARAPALSGTLLPDSCLLTGGMEDFFAGMTGPAGGGDPAGDLALFHKGVPVLLPFRGAHSVPTVNGYVQLPGRGGSEAERQAGPGWQMLCMNISRAYPKEAGLSNWQRTWMMAPFEGGIRLMDVFDLEKPGLVTFRLILSRQPRISGNQVRMGDRLTLDFDPSLVPHAQPIPVPAPLRASYGEALWQLSLVTPEPVQNGHYTVFFSAAP